MKTLAQISYRQKIFVLIGIMTAMFLAALDQTIVATAMPRIVQELHGLEELSWVFTSYMLASTIIVPIYGKLSDMYGRKQFILSAIILFILGSLLAGFSQNMTQLIIFRAVQGIGAGAIFANSFAIIGDLFPPAQRGKWTGLFGAIFALSSIIGPSLGGFLTDALSWRWNFFINVPLGLFAMGAVWTLLPKIVPENKNKSIDYAGALMLTIGLLSLLLGFVWGGNQYAWQSIQIIILFLGATISFILFGMIEKKAKDPLLPLSLFKNQIFTVSMLTVFLVSMGMFGTILYLPLFAQVVLGVSATDSGTLLTPFMLGSIVASIITGQIISRTGKYKWITVLGLAIATITTYFLSKITMHSTQNELLFLMIATGLGIGTTYPTFTISVQNAFEHSKLGVVTAASQLFRSIGGTIGTAIFGGILNASLAKQYEDLASDPFAKFLPQQTLANIDANTLQQLLSDHGKQMIEATIQQLPIATQTQANKSFLLFIEKIKYLFAGSIAEVFFFATGIMALAFVISLFLKELPLKQSHEQTLEEIGKELAEEEAILPAKDEPRH